VRRDEHRGDQPIAHRLLEETRECNVGLPAIDEESVRISPNVGTTNHVKAKVRGNRVNERTGNGEEASRAQSW